MSDKNSGSKFEECYKFGGHLDKNSGCVVCSGCAEAVRNKNETIDQQAEQVRDFEAESNRYKRKYFDSLGELEQQAEIHRMQLAGISTISGCNTKESMKQQGIEKTNPYWTPAFEDTKKAVEREMILIERIKELENWHQKRSGQKVPEPSCPYCDNAKRAYFKQAERIKELEENSQLMHTQNFRDMWEERKSLLTELRKAVIHIDDLLEPRDEDCRYDHHGYCQNHMDFTGDKICYVKNIRLWKSSLPESIKKLIEGEK